MSSWIIMEEGHIYLGVVDKTAIDKWVTKIIICHSVCVDSKHFIDFDLLFFNFLFSSCFPAKNSQPKLSIIAINTSKLRPIRVLFYLLYLDVLVLTTPNFFLKRKLEVCKAIHFDPRLLVICFGDGHDPWWIIRDIHRDNWIHGDNSVMLQQVAKDLAISLEFGVRLLSNGISLGVFYRNDFGFLVSRHLFFISIIFVVELLVSSADVRSSLHVGQRLRVKISLIINLLHRHGSLWLLIGFSIKPIWFYLLFDSSWWLIL